MGGGVPSKHELAKSMGIDLPTGEGVVRKSGAKNPEHGAEIVRRAGYGKVNAESLSKFLEHYMKCGHIAKAALMAGLSYGSIQQYKKKDPVFQEEVDQAHAIFVAEVLESAAIEQGVTGILKPIYNTKTGQLLGSERIVQPRILELLLKRHDPAYRDKQDVNMNHSGGVVVVTAPVLSADDWKARVASRNQNLIEADPSTLPSKPVEDSLPPEV